MRDSTSPVQLRPGDTLTIHDIHRLLPHATRIAAGKLVVTHSIRFRHAAVPPTPPKPPIVPFKD